MNKSKNINPRVCRTCGKCCKVFTIGYNKDLLSKNPNEDMLNVFSEVQRFLELQTDSIYVIEYKEMFSVVFDFPCENLGKDKGVYTCKTYTKGRPLLCERYPYKENDCERFVKPINIFRDSKDFLKRVEEIKGDEK